MPVMPSFILGLAAFVLALIPVDFGGKHSEDELITSSGTYASFRLNDSTRFLYGTFTIVSGTEQTRISAHRLKVGSGRNSANSFTNDLLEGRVYTDGVELHINILILKDLFRLGADNVRYSSDSTKVQLQGHATIQCDDLRIESNRITIFTSQWGTFPR